ncbi:MULTISPECIES: hypothetical protein [unclassified Rhizobium]|nr:MULTISPECIES: hypothetical protein [unclassified Rhizobium]
MTFLSGAFAIPGKKPRAAGNTLVEQISFAKAAGIDISVVSAAIP